jgi:2-(1,2-epoxy-1,2-dihydrophenyl)acetyl-CoA isomerase
LNGPFPSPVNNENNIITLKGFISMANTIQVKLKQTVAYITLNRPNSRNAFNREMRLAFLNALEEIELNPTIKVILITGTGKGFCAGADLTEEIPDTDGYITKQLQKEYAPIIRAIKESKKIVLSSVNGAAAGIGASIVLASDLVIMADTAYLYSAFGAIALIPDGGFHWLLARTVGPKRAFEMIIESQRLDAKTCRELGLINKVVTDDELSTATTCWVKSLANVPHLTSSLSKEILRNTDNQTLSQSMDLEAKLQNTCIHSDDFKKLKVLFLSQRTSRGDQ